MLNTCRAEFWEQRYFTEPEHTVQLDRYTPVIRDLLLTGKEIVNNFVSPQASILDVGGGDGRTTRFYGLNSERRVSVVDFSEQALAIARRNGMEGKRCDIETDSLPYDSGCFDVVLLQEVLEHVNNYTHVLQEAWRVLRRGGLVYITTPNLAGFIDRCMLLRGKKPLCMRWDESHVRFFTFDELSDLLLRTGFELRLMTTQGAYFALGAKFFKLPFVAKIRRKLGQHIIIVAAKA